MLLFTEPLRIPPAEPPDIEALMDAYGTELLRLCTMILKNRDLAEDALQETFIRVYYKYSSFHGDSAIKTWITSIAMNVCRDMMRRSSYREQRNYLPLSDEDMDPAVQRHEYQNLTVQETDREAHMDLVAAIGELPPDYRKVILLFYYSGYAAEEIAKVLHCPASTVRSRLKRARDMLRRELEC